MQSDTLRRKVLCFAAQFFYGENVQALGDTPLRIGVFGAV